MFAELLRVGKDLDGYGSGIAPIDFCQPHFVERILGDLTDTDSRDLFGVLGSDLGIHLGIFFTAVSHEDELALRQSLHDPANDPSLALAANDAPPLEQFIAQSEPFQMHASLGKPVDMQELVQRVVDLPRTAADVMKQCAALGPLSIQMRHAGDALERFGERSSEHSAAVANIGEFDRVIDIADDADALGLSEKDLATSGYGAFAALDMEFLLVTPGRVPAVASVILQDPPRYVELAGKQAAGPGFSRQDMHLVGEGDMKSVARDRCDEETLDPFIEQRSLRHVIFEFQGSNKPSQHQAFGEREGDLFAHPALNHQSPHRPSVNRVGKRWEELNGDLSIISVIPFRTHAYPLM